MLGFEVLLTFTYSALSTNKSLLVNEWWKLESFAVFLELPFQPWETSSLQQPVLAAVAWRCLLVHPLFLQNLVFLLPVCVFWMRALRMPLYLLVGWNCWIVPTELLASSPQPLPRRPFGRSVRLKKMLNSTVNQAGPVSHSLLLSSSTLIARLLKPLTWFHCETLVISKISATLFATNTCCLRWELWIHCRTVVESVLKLQLWIFASCSFTICSLSLTAITAACNSKCGMERCRIGATLHFPITNVKSAEYSFGFDRRYATAHIVSSDASADTWSSHLSLAVLKYLLSLLVSATSGSCAFHFKNSSSSLGSTELSQCCPFLVQMLFRSRLI